MYYETEEQSRVRVRRTGPSPLGRILRFLIALIIILGIVSIAFTSLVDGGWTHILLLGIDHDSSGTSRSDTMIVASIGPLGQVRLTSVLRDTWADIPGYNPNKINAAYRYGGAELAMETISKNLGIDIKYYVLIDYHGLPMIIDSIGGITIANISSDEKNHINSNLASTRKALAKTGVDLSDLEVYGENIHLTGAQALSYARIRKLGSDYERTARQRRVLQAMVSKVRQNPFLSIPMLNQALSVTKTNVHIPRLVIQGIFALFCNDIQELRLPADGTFQSGDYNGVWCIRPDWNMNRKLLQEFLTY